MSKGILSTLFETGAKDELAAVDVYSVTDTKVKTSLLDTLQNTSKTVIDAIVANPDLLQTVSASLIKSGGKIAFDKSALLDSLSSTGLGSKAKALAGDLSPKITSAIGQGLDYFSDNPNFSQGIFSSIDGIKNDICGDDYGSASSVTDFLSLLTGKRSYSTSRDDEASLLHAMLGQAISNCQPAAFEAILDHYSGKPEYDEMARSVAANSFYNASMSGRIDVNKSLVDRLGGPTVLAQVPNATEVIMTNYSIPYAVKPNGYNQQLNEMIDLLESLDPEWDTVERQVQTIDVNGFVVTSTVTEMDLSVFATASEDARKLFKTHPDYRDAVIISENYPPINVKENVKRKYPNYHFSN